MREHGSGFMTTASHTPDVAIDPAFLRRRIDAALQTLVGEVHPESLYGPARYVLDNGGKRFRPMLLLLTAHAFGASEDEALPAALAVEVFHNFTLVHDDIMDHASERRGRPTVHMRWDESTAILCGDYLMGLAYGLLARTNASPGALIECFGTMTIRICEGQALDKAFEKRADVPLEAWLDMVDRKTGALLQASLELGGILGGAGAGHLRNLRAAGLYAGRGFQIRDDLLDLTAEDARWGKAIGGDLVEGKTTYLLLRAIERSRGEDRAWFEQIIEGGGLAADRVPEARERMQRLGVTEDAQRAVVHYTQEALQVLDRLPKHPSVDVLCRLLTRMQERLH